ncbi:hypothetical protein [Palleronia caenipelagi]|uniref:hypothetical protein n=1 Tax=Palleronia caenipelagi TaxID=2489174 RepID=UPI00163DB047|nr:hypothetical protein [Palleronia caenipelagi]
MSDTLLSDLPDTICAAVRTRMPELRECRPHAGLFNLEELKKTGLPSPSVLISMLGARQDTPHAGAPAGFLLQMAAYVTVKDALGAPRDIRAANICQVLLQLIPEQRWGVDAFGAARAVRMHTLISGKTRDHGVSLWAVTWDQPVSFFAPPDAPLGLALYLGEAPKIGAAHEDDYTRIGGRDV